MTDGFVIITRINGWTLYVHKDFPNYWYVESIIHACAMTQIGGRVNKARLDYICKKLADGTMR